MYISITVLLSCLCPKFFKKRSYHHVSVVSYTCLEYASMFLKTSNLPKRTCIGALFST